VPSPIFFPDSLVQKLPAWAQRHVVLGLDLQGGSHILLQVDANDVLRQKVEGLRDDVRRVLRDARVGITGQPVVRGNTVEVHIRDSDLQQGLTKLRELAAPIGGVLGATQRSVDIVICRQRPRPAHRDRAGHCPAHAPGGRSDRSRSSSDGSTRSEPWSRLIQRQGADRILVQVPGLQDPQRLKDILGKTARLEFRMVDSSMSPDQALQGRPPPDSEVLYGPEKEGKMPYLIEKRVLVAGADLTDAQPGFDQRTSEPIVQFRFNASGARKFAQATQVECRAPHSRSCSTVR